MRGDGAGEKEMGKDGGGFLEPEARGGLWVLDLGGNPAAEIAIRQSGGSVVSLSI